MVNKHVRRVYYLIDNGALCLYVVGNAGLSTAPRSIVSAHKYRVHNRERIGIIIGGWQKRPVYQGGRSSLHVQWSLRLEPYQGPTNLVRRSSDTRHKILSILLVHVGAPKP